MDGVTLDVLSNYERVEAPLETGDKAAWLLADLAVKFQRFQIWGSLQLPGQCLLIFKNTLYEDLDLWLPKAWLK